MAKKRKSKKNNEPLINKMDFELDSETKKHILVIVLFAAALISILSLFGVAGDAGRFLTYILGLIFGWASFIFPLILLGLGWVLLFPDRYDLRGINYFGIVIFILSFTALLHLFIPPEEAVSLIEEGRGGGYIGLALSFPLQRLMGFWAALILIIALFIISILTMFNTTLARLVEPGVSLGEKFSGLKFLSYKLRGISSSEEEEEDEDEEDEEEEDEDEEDEEEEQKFKTKKIKTPKKEKPLLDPQPEPKFKGKIDIPLNLLSGHVGKPTSGDIKANMETIQKTLADFGIPVTMGEFSVGPTVTQYTFKPAEGIKLSRIVSLQSDLALALAAHPIRIEAPIPGKSLVGIEVPNRKIAMVNLREILESSPFKKRSSNITVGLGKDVAGHCWTADIAKMPHLLVAGSTGSGKSVCLNTMILSLLFQNGPGELKFIMVDPKRVELPVYNGIPHLLTPVITDVTKTVNALKWAILEMDRRLELLSKAGKRNISSYNAAQKENKLPYIIIVIDELADLMVAAASEVEHCIIRIAQMARAVGIHLVLATQRPSVDIITGLIKANIPSRIAFSVASVVDSRTILDTAGAEKLLGRGDMLYTSAELSSPKRLQGAFVSDQEIKNIINYLKEQGEPDYREEVTERPKSSPTAFEYSEEDGDELLEEAKEVIFSAGKASASLLQRRLKVGYARAARILDLLEEQGIIGPSEGAKPREILINPDEHDNMDEPEEDDSGDEDVSETDEEESDYNENDDEESEDEDDYSEEDEEEEKY